MQLQNIECQIAKAQIGRYLAGDALSDETVSQLEGHISKCLECKQNLAERKSVLQAMLAPSDIDTRASKPEFQQPTPQRFDLADFIKSKVQAKQPVQAVVQTPDSKPSNFWKPALYSIGLGAVLIGMSYASKNIGSLLGSKVAENPAAVTSSPDRAASVEPKASQFEQLGSAWASAADEIVVAEPDKAVAPKQHVPKPPIVKPKQANKRPTKTHHTPRPVRNSIRVYKSE